MKYLKTIWLGKTNRTGYVLFFIKSKNENEHLASKSSFMILLWENKWKLLFIIIICVLYYVERNYFVHLHNAL